MSNIKCIFILIYCVFYYKVEEHNVNISKDFRKKNSMTGKYDVVRMSVKNLLEHNSVRVQGWIDDIAKDDPKGAVDTIIKLMEFHMPKMARQEKQLLDICRAPA